MLNPVEVEAEATPSVPIPDLQKVNGEVEIVDVLHLLPSPDDVRTPSLRGLHPDLLHEQLHLSPPVNEEEPTT